ncbi:Fanconi anemia group C -like [Paramuricea clavata]|uniref:Fanconi anemia group C -like n=1 Tax=Paramuricea clavata TaxID=317549 RepID=A0A6S7GW88_PARCT|nr:Fanconi anemia group C -like [Paramuricea clavata]
MVQTTEDLYRLVLHCVTAVAVSSQQHRDGINEKSIKWVKSQIKTVCSSYPGIVSSSVSLAEQFGLQPVGIAQQFNNELVSSLVGDLSSTASCREWSDLHRQFIPRYPIEGTTLRNISEMCLPILLKPVIRPLIEALLCCEKTNDIITDSNSNSTDVIPEKALSPHFLNALKDNPRDCYLSLSQGVQALSHDARVNLWMQDHIYFEDEIISLLEICCFERKYMSRKEMKAMISLRELPKALSENTSLFSITYEVIQRVIYETSGNLHVMKFVGVLLQLISDVQRQKNKTQLADTFNVNYANIWSVELASFVNLLTVDWAGFPDQLQRCYWVVLFASTQFVEPCLTILLWYHGGGTQFDDTNKIKLRYFVDTLRHLRNKSQIMTSDILCALDNIMGLTNVQQNVIIIIRYLVTLFMLMSCSADNLDIPQIIFKLTEDLPVPNVFDQLLDVVEETFSFQSNSQWFSTNFDLNRFSTNSLKYLNVVYTRFDEYVSQHPRIRIQVESLDNHDSMINDLRSRFQILSKLLRKETG